MECDGSLVICMYTWLRHHLYGDTHVQFHQARRSSWYFRFIETMVGLARIYHYDGLCNGVDYQWEYHEYLAKDRDHCERYQVSYIRMVGRMAIAADY